MSGCLGNVFACCSPVKEREINVETKNKVGTISPDNSKTKEMTNNKNINSFSSFTFSKPTTTAKSHQQNQTQFFDSVVLSTISFQSTNSFNQSGMSSLRFYYEDDSDEDKKKSKNKLKPPKTKIIYKTK